MNVLRKMSGGRGGIITPSAAQLVKKTDIELLTKYFNCPCY